MAPRADGNEIMCLYVDKNATRRYRRRLRNGQNLVVCKAYCVRGNTLVAPSCPSRPGGIIRKHGHIISDRSTAKRPSKGDRKRFDGTAIVCSGIHASWTRTHAEWWGYWWTQAWKFVVVPLTVKPECFVAANRVEGIFTQAYLPKKEWDRVWKEQESA